MSKQPVRAPRCVLAQQVDAYREWAHRLPSVIRNARQDQAVDAEPVEVELDEIPAPTFTTAAAYRQQQRREQEAARAALAAATTVGRGKRVRDSAAHRLAGGRMDQ